MFSFRLFSMMEAGQNDLLPCNSCIVLFYHAIYFNLCIVFVDQVFNMTAVGQRIDLLLYYLTLQE